MDFPKIMPIRPKVRKTPFNDPDFFFEQKFDGYRGILYNNEDSCRLVSKNKGARQFPKLERYLQDHFRSLPVILDGEVCVLNDAGFPDFAKLQARHEPMVYFVFDIMWHKERDLRSLPLHERKKILHQVIQKHHGNHIHVATAIRGSGIDLFNTASSAGLEGIVGKSIHGTYSPKTRWYKILNPSYPRRRWKH